MAKKYRFLGVSPTPAVCCAWKVAGVKATDRVDAPPAEIWDEPAGSLPSWMTGDDYDD